MALVERTDAVKDYLYFSRVASLIKGASEGEGMAETTLFAGMPRLVPGSAAYRIALSAPASAWSATPRTTTGARGNANFRPNSSITFTWHM